MFPENKGFRPEFGIPQEEILNNLVKFSKGPVVFEEATKFQIHLESAARREPNTGKKEAREDRQKYLESASKYRRILSATFFSNVSNSYSDYLPNLAPALILLSGERSTQDNSFHETFNFATVKPEILASPLIRNINLDSDYYLFNQEKNTSNQEVASLDQNTIRKLLLKATREDCTDFEARQILQRLAAAGHGSLHETPSDGSNDLQQALTDNLFTQIFKLDRKKLSALFPVFVQLCGNRNTRTAQVDWNFVKENSLP